MSPFLAFWTRNCRGMCPADLSWEGKEIFPHLLKQFEPLTPRKMHKYINIDNRINERHYTSICYENQFRFVWWNRTVFRYRTQNHIMFAKLTNYRLQAPLINRSDHSFEPLWNNESSARDHQQEKKRTNSVCL